jgi:hypothetical protein
MVGIGPLGVYRLYKNVNHHIHSPGLSSLTFRQLHIYDTLLLGFVKCNKAWVESWFPTREELDKLNKIKPLRQDHTYFLRYEEEGNKRRAVDVSNNWVKETFFTKGWQTLMSVSPW